MKETLISFDLAKLAKEKNFDIPTYNAFDLRIYKPSSIFSENLEEISNARSYSNSEFERFNRPTQSLLQKWLRETYNIEVCVFPGWENSKRIYELWIWIDSQDTLLDDTYNDYEEDLESGLIIGLNRINIVKE